jgi:hypothetical protein
MQATTLTSQQWWSDHTATMPTVVQRTILVPSLSPVDVADANARKRMQALAAERKAALSNLRALLTTGEAY